MHVHLIGIGGSGLSAIARVLLERGDTVSGSDRQSSALTRSLQQAGARVFHGHRPEHIAGADLVIRSSAISEDNVEVQAARAAGVPVLKRADFLGRLMHGRLGIAVAGTHGKTTTTAMIAWVLTALGQDPSYIIGGVSKNLGGNAHAGSGQAFVIEADEYDRMFLGLKPHLAVVTNVEYDHPDCFATPAEYHQAFLEFAGCLNPNGRLLVCADDPGAARLGQEAQQRGIEVLTYGLGETGLAYGAHALLPNERGGYTFQATCCMGISLPASSLPPFPASPLSCELQAPGVHNVRNALAALAAAHQMGLSPQEAAQALARYQGVSRRFDVLGEAGGVTIIDDYAHHPSEIRATLAAARRRYADRRIWAVWQPHTYSRTRALRESFGQAFEAADCVLVTQIYAAREPQDGQFTSQDIAAAMRHPNVRMVETLQQATDYLLSHIRAGDVLLVLSAGDADQISRMVWERLRNNP